MRKFGGHYKKQGGVFRRSKEWLEDICLIVLAKKRKHMVIWQPSVLIKDEKFFSKGENWMGEKKVIIEF